MRVLAFLTCFFCLACTSQAMTPSEFTAKFAKAVGVASPTSKVTVKSDLEVQLVDPHGKELTAFLDNAYNEYLQDQDAEEAVIQRYALSLLETSGDETKIDPSRIVPVIKDRQWLSEIAQASKEIGGDKAIRNVFEDFNDQLVIVYAEDGPTRLRYFTSEDLGEIGMARVELRELAVANLKRILPKVELHKGPLVSMITADGNYEASLVLLDELWSGGAVQVDGDIVVALPSRDLLLVTGSKIPGGIARLREMAAESSQQASYRLTDTLFVYRDGVFLALPSQ